MAYLGRPGATAPLTSADIPDNSITTAKIVDDNVTAAKIPAGAVSSDVVYLENNTSTQDLSGTYSTERMYFNDSYQLTGDVTVTGHLALGTVADADVVITNDLTARTLTVDGGVIEAGGLLAEESKDLTGMTGALEDAVTGSPNLNLGNATFPTGHIVAQKMATFSADADHYIDVGTATSWVGTTSGLELTHAMSHADNLLIFTFASSRVQVDYTAIFLLVGVGLTSDLTTNILDYAGEGDGPGTQHANGKFWNIYSTQSGESVHHAMTVTMKHSPGTTASRIYQPIQYGNNSGGVARLVAGNTAAFAHFMLTEVVV
jgi:hypothetical protein